MRLPGIRRTLTAAVVAVVAVGGLSACQSKIGVAATVGSHRITESDLGKYVTSAAVPFSVQGQSGSTTIVPKVYALQTLIVNELFAEALADTKGGAPSASLVAAAIGQITSGATTAQQNAQYTKYGFTKSFAQIDLHSSALESILAQRLGVTTDATPIFNELTKLKLPVTVAGRYGSWDAKTLSIDAAGGTPSFIHIGSAAPSTGP